MYARSMLSDDKDIKQATTTLETKASEKALPTTTESDFSTIPTINNPF
jgi:hypothetical protein